jgi:hypothetical protein
MEDGKLRVAPVCAYTDDREPRGRWTGGSCGFESRRTLFKFDRGEVG